VTHRIRHRPHSILRNASLLLLLLCLIAQPVLAAWGEMHELTAHAETTGQDSALDHRAPHAHTTIEEGSGADASDPTHALSHHAHCCGQPQLPFLSQLPLPLFEPASMMPSPATTRPIAASHSATPFRPPIAG
jgi:hypothetical protein